MSTLSLRLPNSMHRQIRELAKREGISVNQLISTAVAEKLSALMTEDYLKTRAARGDQAAYEAVLAGVPEAEVPDTDRVEPE